jgi:stearoyl-CoA desaturase (delta-9 desaturase)
VGHRVRLGASRSDELFGATRRSAQAPDGPRRPVREESPVVACLVFFVLHWQLSVFCQTFFLHRYAAHRMFRMSKGWERFFHLLTWASQGSSYLSPRAYAILHRMHHAYSDTEKDPHSPYNHKGLAAMMWHTAKVYTAIRSRKAKPEDRFEGGYPEWKLLDETLSGWVPSLLWGTAYTLFYIKFATTPWLFLLVPLHYVMGPIHGAIVNWCGHKYGYQNFDNHDQSRNTLFFDFVTLGELFQNNHHKYGMSPNFAARGFELDPTYQVMRLLAAVKVIDMDGAQTIPRAGASRRKGARTSGGNEAPVLPVASPMDAE